MTPTRLIAARAALACLCGPVGAHAAPPHRQSVASLQAAWLRETDLCVGSSKPSDIRTHCPVRDAIETKLVKMGWCWGHDDQTGAEKTWVKCSASERQERLAEPTQEYSWAPDPKWP